MIALAENLDRPAPPTFFAAALTGATTPLLFEVGRRVTDALGDPRAALYGIPLLTAVAFFPLFSASLASGRLGRTVALSLVWALACSIVTIALVSRTGERYTDVLVRAETYRTEMFEWVRTGVGEESSPSRFLPVHATHCAAFVVLSRISLGFFGLAMGAALLHYMNFYVGSLLAHATHPVAIALLGWPPYAVIRVIGYVTLASALAALGRRRARGESIEIPAIRRALLVGFALVVLDVLVKATVAPSWGEMLAGWVALPK